MTEEGRKEKERGQEHTQWGEVGEGEAVCGVSVTCPGGVAWVECAAQGVGGYSGVAPMATVPTMGRATPIE